MSIVLFLLNLEVLEENAPERDQLYKLFNNFFHRLKNTARRHNWGPETHTPLILHLFDMIEKIIPAILDQYQGEEREQKMLGIGVQLRFTIDKIMTYVKFNELMKREGMNILADMVKDCEKSEVEIPDSIMEGFTQKVGEPKKKFDFIC